MTFSKTIIVISLCSVLVACGGGGGGGSGGGGGNGGGNETKPSSASSLTSSSVESSAVSSLPASSSVSSSSSAPAAESASYLFNDNDTYQVGQVVVIGYSVMAYNPEVSVSLVIDGESVSVESSGENYQQVSFLLTDEHLQAQAVELQVNNHSFSLPIIVTDTPLPADLGQFYGDLYNDLLERSLADLQADLNEYDFLEFKAVLDEEREAIASMSEEELARIVRFILANKLNELDAPSPQARAFAAAYPLLAKTTIDSCWDVARNYPLQLTATVASVAVVATGTVTGQWLPAGVGALLAYYNIKQSMNVIDLVMEHCFLPTGNALIFENYGTSRAAYNQSGAASLLKTAATSDGQNNPALTNSIFSQRLGPLYFEHKQMKRFKIQEEVMANSAYIGQDFQDLVESLHSWMIRIQFVASRFLPQSYYDKLSDYANLMWRPAAAVEFQLGNISDPNISVNLVREGEYMDVIFSNNASATGELTEFTFDLLRDTQVTAQYDATLRNNCWDAQAVLANQGYINRYVWFVDGGGSGPKAPYADEYMVFKPNGTYILTDYYSYPDNRWDEIAGEDQYDRGGSWYYDCPRNKLSIVNRFWQVRYEFDVDQQNPNLFIGHCVGLCESTGHNELIKN
jgi:hypothetical protein